MENATLVVKITATVVLEVAIVAAIVRRPLDTPTVVLVRRRRELLDELRRIIPDELEVGRILQAEALRLRVTRFSLEALEAAPELARRDKWDARVQESRFGTP